SLRWRLFCLRYPLANRWLHSFPTRRSSDLMALKAHALSDLVDEVDFGWFIGGQLGWGPTRETNADPLDGHPLTFHHLLPGDRTRSEEHTSELQSRFDLVCRLLLEKKKQPHH